MLMDRNNSLLLIIDVQERLAPAMDSPREVINITELWKIMKRM